MLYTAISYLVDDCQMLNSVTLRYGTPYHSSVTDIDAVHSSIGDLLLLICICLFNVLSHRALPPKYI